MHMPPGADAEGEDAAAEDAAPAEAEDAAPAEAETKLSIDGEWKLVGDTEGLGDITSISGQTGKMMAVGVEIGTYTFKELDDVVKGFKGECKCPLLEGDVEGKLSATGDELELTVSKGPSIARISVTANFKRKGGADGGSAAATKGEGAAAEGEDAAATEGNDAAAAKGKGAADDEDEKCAAVERDPCIQELRREKEALENDTVRSTLHSCAGNRSL